MNISIIGAGPRGLIIAANLIQKAHTTNKLQIDLYDPYPIGGRVWQTNQSLALIMNSSAQLITLFNDFGQTSLTGPTFYEWSQSKAAVEFIKNHDYENDFLAAIKNLKPNDYAPRALFGVYAQWFYNQLKDNLPQNIKLNFHHEKVIGVQKIDGKFKLTTETNTVTTDSLVLSTGNSTNQLSKDEISLKNYAQKNKLQYFIPTYPAEANFTKIRPREKVIIRGMGLSFFYYLTELTIERGGSYTENHDGSLTYHPSGREPQIYAGSRRGVPYYPKALNQQKVGENRPNVFLNQNTIQQYMINGKLPFKKFVELLKAEIEYLYYPLLIIEKYPQDNAEAFASGFLKSDDRATFIGNYHFKNEDILDWNLILNPVAGVSISTIESYQKIILQWMELIINDAKLGTKTAPVTGALSKIVDLRTTIQKIVTQHLLTDDEYVTKFLQLFNSFSGFLTAGPPLLRYRQLQALMKANIVTILGPQLQVIGANQKFIARSKLYPKEIFQCNALIEARVPKPNLEKTTNPLLIDLRNQGLITAHLFHLSDGQQTASSAVDVDLMTYQAINKIGKIEPQLFIWGVPLQGLEWLTTSLPHALSDDHNFAVSDIITHQILK
ncbi:hypothetical protein BGL34_03355 [Fructilactobacillus lindneri]|uniref:FAD-dependent urate hydroxylase HpyO/Asp monooxygenase CreE-like FAD/NAD(P)-binding domain-containing protein n=2 Tax=Fructilactobacillus lindneri TaxID=53444 RepID=A0A0R2JVU9_9LACO|nr:FAD/NAD(P)-binding protein [Fructilactobacillus lindneri]ANZ57835.1 hypothetical protein AYR60_03175 [Fructilactobacillus lindneri]ANZ59104.1 hypothetical protein AYR59_03175 [Fructilactobacillus lindneri]KRN78711.1 hypothetical protein IV52_GL000988 [Fructilactobacillus lindneri DSM 20690 = JCM 11027]POG98157.1 hypothetical protein BGL31_03505 [Fructilactobacillus lindneri]POH01727.1 hypothetical protein BGL32_03925 [Fructilactobacillus lindneri]